MRMKKIMGVALAYLLYEAAYHLILYLAYNVW
jgi:hypothetical protein